jgi:hypothetical protein
MYVFGCTLMSKPSVHCGGTEFLSIGKESFIVTRLSYMVEQSAQPIKQTNWRSTSNNQSMGTCKGAFPPRILRKQRRPLAFQTMNCTPADYQLQKSVGQTTDRNRAMLPSLFGMKFTQVPGKNTATDLQNKPCHPTIQLPFT